MGNIQALAARDAGFSAAYTFNGRRAHFNEVLYWYIPGDIISLLLGFALALKITGLANRLVGEHDVYFSLEHAAQLGLLFLNVILWFMHTGHYRARDNFWLEVKKIADTLIIAAMVDGFLQYATKGTDFSRLLLISGWSAAALCMILTRVMVRRTLIRLGRWEVSSLMVGGGATAEDTLAAFASDSSLGYKIKARVLDLPREFLESGKSWKEICAKYQVDYVIIALDGKELEQADEAIAQLIREPVHYSVSPPRLNLPVTDMVPQYFFNHDVRLLTRHSGLDQPLSCSIKRSFDFIVAGLILLLLSPILIMIALAVKMDGGPATYGHLRVGRYGKTFRCLKFRTMSAGDNMKTLEAHLERHPEAMQEWRETRKLKDDPRVTRPGKLLRKLSLDELPQLINVLKGDMSLVGPRPIVNEEVQKYADDISYYYQVRPGITGLWQVSGRSDVTYAQRVQMDSWYVRNWSLWHDIAILCKTIPALLKRSGAY